MALQAFKRERHLDGDVVGDRRKHFRLAHHVGIYGGGDLGRDRAFHDLADLLGDVGDLAAGFQDQRRVGGDAVEQAEIVQLVDFLHVGCVDKELHRASPDVVSPAAKAALSLGFHLAQSAGKVTR